MMGGGARHLRYSTMSRLLLRSDGGAVHSGAVRACIVTERPRRAGENGLCACRMLRLGPSLAAPILVCRTTRDSMTKRALLLATLATGLSGLAVQGYAATPPAKPAPALNQIDTVVVIY